MLLTVHEFLLTLVFRLYSVGIYYLFVCSFEKYFFCLFSSSRMSLVMKVSGKSHCNSLKRSEYRVCKLARMVFELFLLLVFCALLLRYATVSVANAVTPIVNDQYNNDQYIFDIEEKTLGRALDKFVQTTKLQLLYPHYLEIRTGINPVVGKYGVKEALSIMLSNTKFSGGLTKNGVLIVIDNASCITSRESKMSKYRSVDKIFFAGMSAFCIAAGVNAQEDKKDSGYALEEITVTAQRRSESLSTVPLNIVAETQISLDKKGVRSIDDLARLQPSITFGQSAQYFGPGQSQIAIRGIASSSGIPTTGVYIDDAPIQIRTGVTPSLSNPYPRIFDLERVEVLNGPQGTLFGTGSMGGAVRFITPAPSYDETSMYARAEASTTKNGSESYEAGYAFGAPIIEDKVGFRGSIFTRTDGGYIDRLDRLTDQLVDEDINSESVLVGRVAVGFRATDTLTITPSLFYQDLEIDDSSRYEVAASNASASDFSTSLDAFPQYNKDKFYLPALEIEYEMDDMTLISNTSYLSRDTSSRTDDLALSLALNAEYSDQIPAQFSEYFPSTVSDTSQRVFTQELRLQGISMESRLNWVVGVHYIDATTKDSFDGSDERLLDVMQFGAEQAVLNGRSLYAFPDDPASGFFPGDITSVSDVWGVELYQGKYFVSQDISHTDKQTAIFGQIDYDLTDKLTATVGLRYTKADYDYTSFIAGPLFAGPDNPVDYETNGKRSALNTSSSPVTPKFGISYQADDNNLFYANAAKGFRGPGISEAAGSTCAAEGAAIGFDAASALNVKSDSLWSYELGSKNTLMGGKLNIDAALYTMRWSDVQFQFLLPNCQKFATLNQGDAQIDGLNIALAARPLDGLTIGVAVAYTDARYTTDFLGEGGTIIRQAGEPFDVAPWSWSVNSEYVLPIKDVDYYGRFDYTKTTKEDKPVDVNSPLIDPDLPRPPATEQLNLRFGGRFQDYDISLFVNNITNEQPELALTHDGAGSQFFRAGTFRPRTVGITLTMRK